MKKLVVLAMLLAAGMLFAQAAAAPAYPQITTAGKVEYLLTKDFAAGLEYTDKPVIEWKWTVKPDDLTSIYVELDATSTDNLNATGQVAKAVETPFDRGWFTVDLAKAFKIPVPVTLKSGFDEYKGKDAIKVTKTEWEDQLGGGAIKQWGAMIEVVPAPVFGLRAAFAYDPSLKKFLIGAYGSQGPVTYEATYSTNGQDMNLGWIEGGVKFAQDVAKDVNVGVAVMGEYNMDDETNAVAYWQASVGANVTYQKMVALGVAWRGAKDKNDTLDTETGAVQVSAWAAPVAGQPLELLGVVGIGIAEDVYPETFDSFEIGMKYSIGKAYFYTGLYWTPEEGTNIAKEWADLDVVAGENTALFFRAGLSF